MTTTSSEIRGQTNERIFSRILPSQPLQPYLNVRPLNTKYTKLPIVEPRQLEFSVPLNIYKTYDINKIFNPGDRNAPYSGYAENINIESELKGQIYALQKCSQSVYIPSSTSSLYNNSFIMKTKSTPNNGGNNHDLLFREEKFNSFDPNPNSQYVGIQTWGNSTRLQLKEAADLYCNGDNKNKKNKKK